LELLLVGTTVDRLGHDFRLSDRRRIQSSFAPRDIERKTREVDDATIAAVAAQIVIGTHEDAVDRAGLDAKGTQQALAVVNRVTSNFETFTALDTLFADVNAIDRTGFGALIACDAGREIEAVKTPVSWSYRNRQFWVFIEFGKSLAIRSIRLEPGSQRDPHTVSHCEHRLENIPQPRPDSLESLDHNFPLILSRCMHHYRQLASS
jgi:hypothetical protein